MSLPHKPDRICIRHSRLDPIFWGIWSELPLPDPDESKNLYKAVAMYFGHTYLRGGFWDLVNKANV